MNTDVNFLQLIIATVLFFVMMFGIGFILNMLLKTTWFPIYLLVLILVPVYIWQTWDDSRTFAGNFTAFTFVDILPIIGAGIGAYVSGATIRALRRGGYKMF
ncbi:YuiB family protein [Paenibacillus methanolicus]|uniref:YuiB-like putative membrane protein n=1 Tax=Paenibacillus methanolicus TaxID=582686 RepID=A0A5S5BZ11_9BACL|nr:YuiB family protein [Paenibacillus methanolicus]TYP71310.1 YuiB-like putative membrane protein [Paenibacillus methanolicus]